VAPSRVSPGRCRTHRRNANARQHGRCGSLGATAPSTLRPALATGAGEAPTCCARLYATRRALQRDDSRSGGGAPGLRTALPHRPARRYDDIRRLRQRQHGNTQGSPWPPCLGRQGSQRLRRRRVIPSSAGELPPATSHGYAEWDFSGVPDPVMFRRFLDATDYWFGYSDDSSAGSYDPAWECCVVITNDLVNTANAAEAGDGEVPLSTGTGPHLAAGPSAPPSSPPRGPTSTRSWLKRASLKPSSRRSTTRCGCFEPPSPGSLRARRTHTGVGPTSPRPHQRRLQR
jgi:hypothetical protein